MDIAFLISFSYQFNRSCARVLDLIYRDLSIHIPQSLYSGHSPTV